MVARGRCQEGLRGNWGRWRKERGGGGGPRVRGPPNSPVELGTRAYTRALRFLYRIYLMNTRRQRICAHGDWHPALLARLPAYRPAGRSTNSQLRHLFPFSVPSFSRESAITFQPLLSLRKNAGCSSEKQIPRSRPPHDSPWCTKVRGLN